LYRCRADKIEAVSTLSAARKIGAGYRLAMEHAGQNRWLRALGSGVAASVRSCSHVVHQLWLEVTGSVFLGMAGIGLIALGRSYTKYASGHGTRGRVVVAMCFTLVFTWFGLSSFWRVRKRDSGR